MGKLGNRSRRAPLHQRLALLSFVFLVGQFASSAAQARSRAAIELETRLFAPCCWVQTLDVHESELADKLRTEIERRLATGETALQIEDDLVTRYGEKLRAVPRGSDPRANIPLVVGIALAITLFGLAMFAVRWRRNQGRELASEPRSVSEAEYDQQLDAALRREDENEPPLSAA